MWSQWRARDPASASDTPARTLHRYLPVRTPLLRPKWTGARAVVPYITALSGIAGVTLLLFPFRSQIHPAVFPLSYLVLVVFVALEWGMGAAIIASVAGALAFDYFIIPPINSFNLRTGEDWSALLGFIITSMAASMISVRARRAAVGTETAQNERLQKQSGELR